jgi:glycosyltransferase involved in cell wall biosynthesis
MLSSVTPLVLTYNEAPNLVRTLDALTWAERVLVVDSGSTDETLEIAARFPNVEVCYRTFDTHGAQWNFGLGLIQTEWVLGLDADFVLTDALVQEMRATRPPEEVSAYNIPFIYCIRGRPLRGSLLAPQPRLFRRTRARYVDDGHTQALRVEGGDVAAMRAQIRHDDRKPLARWLASQHKYALLEAEKLSSKADEALRFTDRLRRRKLAPLVVPFYCLFLKRLLLDGRAGLEYTWQRTYAEVLIALELLDRERASHLHES